jgi:Homing endonuclease associated repeat
MERDLAIAELQRVAAALDTRVLSRSTFDKHSDISSATVEATFGTWNEAIEAAGLIKRPPGGLPKSEQRRLERLTATTSIQAVQGISDDELLADLLRLAHDLGRRPSGNQVTAKGKFSSDVYRKRWGSVSHAYEVALSRMK